MISGFFMSDIAHDPEYDALINEYIPNIIFVFYKDIANISEEIRIPC